MRKEETLRGRGSFQSLYRCGRRVDGEVLRCFFQWEIGAGALVRAGFSVSAKRYNAVRRNRAKRLMRAAYEQEREVVADAVQEAGGALTLLFVYNGGNDAKPPQIRFERVRGDMSSLCRKVCAMAGKERR